MKIKLSNIKVVAEGDIALFEKNSGLELPKSYKSFLLKFNGAVPSTNNFNIDEKMIQA